MKVNAHRLLAFFLVLAILVGCGGDEAGGGGEVNPTLEPAPTAEPTPDEKTPAGLGQEIGAVYVEALVEVTELVKDLPPAAEVRADVESLKETYIQRLVALGWEREVLSDADKATVDWGILQVLEPLYEDEEWLNAYQGAVDHYFEEDFDFQQILVSFNIIGQYANFDLLREQEPEEAQRLGVGE